MVLARWVYAGPGRDESNGDSARSAVVDSNRYPGTVVATADLDLDCGGARSTHAGPALGPVARPSIGD